MQEKFAKISQKTIEYSFYLLFFLVPLILTPFNYELFEYNKMMVTYGLAVIIAGAWMIKMVTEKQIRIGRTPLDIPLILFLLSQIISTIFSIDRHVSIWGYYSRFNGGLLSTISYILLYYAFVSNFPKEKIKKLFSAMLTSGILVAIYGILEHFGIDKNIWVQDVENRVFSTLGQPNWLAAYLAVLIPITIGLALNSKIGIYWIIGSIFYITLIFTKSRSGFLGFWISLIIFWLTFIFLTISSYKQSKKITQNHAAASSCVKAIKLIGIYTFIFIVITFLLGAPFSQINRFTLSELTKNREQKTENREQISKPIGSSVIDVGITESSKIRRIVWKGAIDIFQHYPLFGSGVETFAFSYYKFRPVEHNMTSEWDFLYNKAHNEYLNYAATTGGFGLGSYLLFIASFIWWNIKKIKDQRSKIKNITQNAKTAENQKLLTLNCGFALCTLHFALIAGWLSILITNFFGFSVVIVQLFFFLIPAICFVMCHPEASLTGEKSRCFFQMPEGFFVAPLLRMTKRPNNKTMKPFDFAQGKQSAIILIILFVICYLLFVIFKLWYADILFARGFRALKTSDLNAAHQSIKEAIIINSKEPFYYNELSYPVAALAVAFSEQEEATYSALLKDEAILASEMAITISPNNVNFWKTRTRVFYALSQIDEKYFSSALDALEKAKELSPTDPKVRYNIAVLLADTERKKEAIEELQYTIKIKPDYREAYIALSYIYEQDGQKEKAREILEFVLTNMASEDAEVKEKLEELKNSSL